MYAAFLRFCLAWARFDLAIAIYTGRGPTDTERIRGDIRDLEAALDHLEINHA